MAQKKLHFETLQLHVGQENPDPATDAPEPPAGQHWMYNPQQMPAKDLNVSIDTMN